MQDLDDKVTGGTLTAAEWNEVPAELQNLIISTGQSLTSADLNQLGKAVASYSQAGQWYADTGIADAVVLTRATSIKNPTAYVAGQQVRFLVAATNTGAATINVATLGLKEIRDQTDAALVAGDLNAGLPVSLFYDPSKNSGAGAFVLIKSSTAPNVLPRNYIDGFATNVNGTDPLACDIAAGSAKASSNDLDGDLSVATSKKLNAAWIDGGTVGAPVGGFPSALTLTANTWYRVFLIFKATGQTGVGFDTSSGAANLLADAAGDGYVKSRQIGWVYYSGGVIVPFTQKRNRFIFEQPVLDVNASTTSAATLYSLTAPPDNSASAEIVVLAQEASAGSANDYGLITSPDVPDVTPSSAVFNAAFADVNVLQNAITTVNLKVPVSSSGQVRSRWTSNNATMKISTLGFEYNRGQQ